MKRLAVGTVAVTIAAVLTPAPAPAEPSARPATCTIKGTPKADRIFGTRGPDVICGLGGNDRIQASYGQDVVYGGPGADRIQGSRQNDRLFGGDGDDLIYGDEGQDTIDGGDGDDTVIGGLLADQVQGGPGDDDLYGGQGDDVIRGGGGSNYCDRLPGDDTAGCLPDTSDPVVGTATFRTTPVDVTERTVLIGVQVEAGDDTGVDNVVARLRVGGTVVGDGLLLKAGSNPQRRSGTWSGAVDVPARVEPGAGTLEVAVTDRAGKVTTTTYPGRQITVVNDNTDTHPPEADLVSPESSDSFDVSTQTQDVLVRAELTDDVTGVDRAFAYLCPPTGPCIGFEQMTDVGSDVWEATLTIPQGARAGTWSVRIDAYDERNGLAIYGGPALYAKRSDEVYWKPFPMGEGDFTVVR